jgi:hypothetical protein
MVNPDHLEILDDLRQILKLSHVQFERKVMWRQDYQNLLKQYLSSSVSLRQRSQQELKTSVDMNEVIEEAPPFIEDQQRAVFKPKLTILNQSQPKSNVIQEIFTEKIELSSQLLETQTSSNSQSITERLQEVEKLIALLDRTFQSLKQEFKNSTQPEVGEPTTEKLEDTDQWETLVKEFICDQETIIADSYEELTDPGEWEKLREDLKSDQKTIVCEQFEEPHPTRAVPDPWS